jgi:hypothetical protein
MAFDFRTEPDAYMFAVLGYVLEGQNRKTWRVQDNPVRRWYHVPWMHTGKIGREFISGLTRELASLPGELGRGQTGCRQNWAVAFYNATGGSTLHQVWGDGTAPPNVNKARFDPGTVVAKLLFTEATASEFAALGGAPTIQANINQGPDRDALGCVADTNPRAPATLRLLQLDVAIRDPRSPVTGWVFGTFIFDGRRPGTDPWDKLTPVGLMWGNDPDLSDAAAATGAKPRESIVLRDAGLGRSFGRGGRMNGPVDNPQSSCLACHMTAQYPSLNKGLAPTASQTEWSDIKCWFRNLAPDQPFGASAPCGQRVPASRSMDYSLQLALGVRNYLKENPNAALGMDR